MKNVSKLTILVIGFIILTSCNDAIFKDKVVIKQGVSNAKILDNSYYVFTEVWVNDWRGLPKTLELYEVKCVKLNEVNEIKKSQMVKAEDIKYKILRLIDKNE